MAKLVTLQVTTSVSLPKGSTGQVEGLWVYCGALGQEETILGKGQTDGSGRAVIKFQVPGEKPPALRITVSPLSRTVKLRRVVTEKKTIEDWKKGRTGWEAAVAVPLTPGFLNSVSWLDELFTVEGVLVSRYSDPATESITETPIRHALVDLFDVDRVQHQKPPLCIPDYVGPSDCVPNKACTPWIGNCVPKTVCKPDLPCIPSMPGICTPSKVGPCGPWVEGEVFDPGIWEKVEVVESRAIQQQAGCCGSETPILFQGVARKATVPVMKPLKSPSLPSALSAASALSSSLSCMPLMAIKSFYKKTQLGTECETGDDGQFIFTFTRKDFFEASAGTTHTEDTDWDEYPDLLFMAKLWLDGQFRTIYDEPYSDTRWNEGTYTWVKLVVNGQMAVGDPGDSDVDLAQTEEFLFHNVGDVEPGWIAGDGVIRTAPDTTSLNEHVFGGGLEIFGQFKMAHVGKYYQIEYQKNGEPDWHPVEGEQWYYSHYLGAGKWETKLKAPESFTSPDGTKVYPACYRVPDYADFTTTRKTQLIAWQTYRMDGNIARYPDGLYHLRVRLLEKTGAYVQPVAGFNPGTQILNLTIDNHWPVAEMDATLYVGAESGGNLTITPVPECGFVQRGAGRYLLIHFQAEDMQTHFRSYGITVNRGAYQATTIPAITPAPVWSTSPPLPGFHYSPPSYYFLAAGDNFPNGYTAMDLGSDPWLSGQPLAQCAYNFTLSVWDRVTNGYGLIHYSQHTLTLTVTE
jgi:hypothetical protein